MFLYVSVVLSTGWGLHRGGGAESASGGGLHLGGVGQTPLHRIL